MIVDLAGNQCASAHIGTVPPVRLNIIFSSMIVDLAGNQCASAHIGTARQVKHYIFLYDLFRYLYRTGAICLKLFLQI